MPSPLKLFTLILIIVTSQMSTSLAQDFTEDDLIELSESYSFTNPFIGDLTVSYPEEWEIEGDEPSGIIFMGETLEFSDTFGTQVGTPTNIAVTGYPSEFDIAEYDEEMVFEVYADLIAQGLGLEDGIEGTLVELDDQLMYYVVFDFRGAENIYVFLHVEGEFIALQALTEDDDVDVLPIVLSVANSVELNQDEPSQTLELGNEHTTIIPEGRVTFRFPDDWEVLDDLLDTEPIVISNDVAAYIEDTFPPFGVYGIRISTHEVSQNGRFARQDGSYTPEELLELLLPDELEDGLQEIIEFDNATGILNAQLAGNHLVMTAVFDTSDDLSVFMQAVVSSRDVGRFRPILLEIVQTFSFIAQDN